MVLKGWRRLAVVSTVAALSALAPAAMAQVLNRGNGSSVGTLDPTKSELHQEAAVIYELFEPLLTLDAVGRPAPGVAERWEISADGLTYRFHLREGAAWSDGTPVTADDFVFAWRRLANPATAAPYAYFVWPILNGEAVTAGRMPPESLGVAAADARTLTVTLKEPTGYFLGQLQHTAMAPVQRANVEKHGDRFTQPGQLVSNGAYMLVENVPQSHIRLVKNPNFHDAAQVTIPEVVFWVTENSETEFKRFRAGELHTTDTLPVTQLAVAKRDYADAYRIAPTYSTFYVGMNLNNEPWKSKPALRAALSMALDREAIVAKVIGGDSRPAYTMVPDGEVGGYSPPRPDWAGWPQAQRDERARALLAQAGYPGGKGLPPIEMILSTSENNRKVAIAMAAMWKQKLGVETRLNNQEFRVVASIGNQKSYQDLLFYGWIGDFPDPINFLKLLLSDVEQQNLSGYKNPAYDKLVNEANLSLDPQARIAMLTQAETMMLADFPVIPVWHNTRRRLVDPRVQGWIPNALDFNLTRYLSLK